MRVPALPTRSTWTLSGLSSLGNRNTSSFTLEEPQFTTITVFFFVTIRVSTLPQGQALGLPESVPESALRLLDLADLHAHRLHVGRVDGARDRQELRFARVGARREHDGRLGAEHETRRP